MSKASLGVVLDPPGDALEEVPSIYSSRSVRSVTMRMREPGTLSSIHFASQTVVRLLPLPWVCQTVSPSRRHPLLRALDSEVRVVPTELLGTLVEYDEVVDQLKEALLAAELEN